MARALAGSVGSLSLIAIAAALTALTPTASHAEAVGSCGEPTIVGTNAPDLLVGTDGADVIAGLAGDDSIFALSGHDVICSGAGFDFIDAGHGDDTVEGGASSDHFRMSATRFFGYDPRSMTPTVIDAAIPDGGTRESLVTVDAGQIADIDVRVWIDHPSPSDLSISIVSPAGAVVTLSQGTGTTSGTQFHGTMFDSEAYVVIAKAPSDVDLRGRFHPVGSLDTKYRGQPACSGTACDWRLIVQDNVANGTAGRLKWWSVEIDYPTSLQDGTDEFWGGDGMQDTVSYTGRKAPVTADLTGVARSGQWDENDVLGGVEHIYTGLGSDEIVGTGGWNDIRTRAGNDVVVAGGGPDAIRGGGADDDIDGGPGDDKLNGNAGIDVLDGGDGFDRCVHGETNRFCEQVA